VGLDGSGSSSIKKEGDGSRQVSKTCNSPLALSGAFIEAWGTLLRRVSAVKGGSPLSFELVAIVERELRARAKTKSLGVKDLDEAHQRVVNALTICQDCLEMPLKTATQRVVELEKKFYMEAPRHHVIITKGSDEAAVLSRLRRETEADKNVEAINGEMKRLKDVIEKTEEDIRAMEGVVLYNEDVREMLLAKLDEAKARHDSLLAQRQNECPLYDLYELALELKNARNTETTRKAEAAANIGPNTKAVKDAYAAWGKLRNELYQKLLQSKSTLLLSDNRCTQHQVPPQHRERPERIREADYAFTLLTGGRGFVRQNGIDETRFFPLSTSHSQGRRYIKEVS